MKRLFDKIYFSAELLSSEVIISGEQNLIKFLISDAIANTEIKDIEFRLRTIDRTEKTIAVIIDWTTFTKTGNEDIYEIENFYCEDLPEFFLKVDSKGKKDMNAREYYKKTDELSTGQRCTTVLPIVFAVSNNPLLIDQPEEQLS